MQKYILQFKLLHFPISFYILQFALCILVGLILLPATIFAITDPLNLPNNKYGIHITDENDLVNAAALVNSSGGDWGYVTVVMREDQRYKEKWNDIFGRMRQLHLIPIIRLATHLEGDTWVKPYETGINEWVEFLANLNWVSKNRYVILFNEPNHAKEWGNTLDPKEYAKFTKTIAEKLKNKSPDFFILAAGLDASAPLGSSTMDEETFLRRMLSAQPEYFDYIDGWASHSYPNPGFSGRIRDRGKGTLRTFLWEKKLLKSLGIDKNLPIFITETGWAHKEGSQINSRFYTAEDVADLIYYAADSIWQEPSIVAVTPFILNYQTFPFSQFSWQMLKTELFYPQFDVYRSLPKVAGRPILEVTPTLTFTLTPIPQQVLSSSVTQINKSMLVKLNDFLKQLISRF